MGVCPTSRTPHCSIVLAGCQRPWKKSSTSALNSAGRSRLTIWATFGKTTQHAGDLRLQQLGNPQMFGHILVADDDERGARDRGQAANRGRFQQPRFARAARARERNRSATRACARAQRGPRARWARRGHRPRAPPTGPPLPAHRRVGARTSFRPCASIVGDHWKPLSPARPRPWHLPDPGTPARSPAPATRRRKDRPATPRLPQVMQQPLEVLCRRIWGVRHARQPGTPALIVADHLVMGGERGHLRVTCGCRRCPRAASTGPPRARRLMIEPPAIHLRKPADRRRYIHRAMPPWDLTVSRVHSGATRHAAGRRSRRCTI